MLEQAKAKHLDEDMKAQLAPLLGSQASQDVNRAMQLQQKGKRDEAQAILDKALEEHPDDPIVLNAVGWFRMNGGDVAGADEMFTKCLAINASDVGAINGKANCLKRQGRVDEAIAMWKEMLEKYPSASAMGWMLAETYMERSEFDKAVPILEKLAQAQPQNKYVQDALERAREGAKK
jgi:predicted Zn-dependent protease